MERGNRESIKVPEGDMGRGVGYATITTGGNHAAVVLAAALERETQKNLVIKRHLSTLLNKIDYLLEQRKKFSLADIGPGQAANYVEQLDVYISQLGHIKKEMGDL